MKNKALFLFALLAALPLAACNWDVNPDDVLDNFYDKRAIVINEKNVAIDLGEEKFVEVIGKDLGPGGSVKSMTYTSCDGDIATAKYGIYDDIEAEEELEGMYITGKKVGFTSIIASFKNASASVDVNVFNSYEIPYIHLFDSSLCIEKDVEYVLPSEIIYKGTTYNTIDNEIIYDFSFVTEKSNDIVELTQDEENGDILINPTKVGSTEVVVSTTFKGLEASTLLKIDVIEPGAGIIIKNEGFKHLQGNNYAANLYVADYGTEYKKTIDLDVEIYKGAELVPGATIAFTSADSTIASVNGYQISGEKKGKTSISGTYDGVTVTIEVNVDKPIISAILDKDVLEVDVDDTLTLTNPSLITSDVTGVYYQTLDTENIFDKYENQKVYIDTDKFHGFVADYGENKKFYIETEQIYIETNAIDVYSKIIKTHEDLKSWGTIAQSYATRSDKFDFDGYFILGNNIECGDDVTPVALDRDTNFKIKGIGDCVGRVGFNGVFDGRGYTINNYKPSGLGSFITWLTQYGQLKNIGFNNVTLDTTLIDPSSADPKAVLIANGSSERGCNVNNVYVNYKSISTKLAQYKDKYCSTFSAMGATNLTCSSVFIDALNATIDGDYDVLGKMACKGVYGLGGVHINGNTDFGEDTPVPDRIFNCTGTYGHFKDTGTMKENLEVQSTISNWDTTYWNIVEGIPVWKTAVNTMNGSK